MVLWPDRFTLIVIAVTVILSGFAFAMSRYVPRYERIARRRLRLWEDIARARGLTFGRTDIWFQLRGDDPRVGPLTVAVEAVEMVDDLAVVVRIPLPDPPAFEFEIAPRAHAAVHTGLRLFPEPLGDPALDRLFASSATDMPALRALLDADARGRIAAHPGWTVGVRGRHALVGWVDFDARTEEALFDDALDLLRVLFRSRS